MCAAHCKLSCIREDRCGDKSASLTQSSSFITAENDSEFKFIREWSKFFDASESVTAVETKVGRKSKNLASSAKWQNHVKMFKAGRLAYFLKLFEVELGDALRTRS